MVKAARNINLKILTGMILVVTLAYNSCTYDKGETAAPKGQCDKPQYTYTADIENIILTNCATNNCHGTGTLQKGFDFRSYSALMAGSDNFGDAVVANDHTISKLWQVVDNSYMPLSLPSLDSLEISLIALWIDEGACE